MGAAANDTELQPALNAISQTIRNTAQGTGNSTELITAGDFNRYHPAWSNNGIHRRIMGDADELLVFMQS